MENKAVHFNLERIRAESHCSADAGSETPRARSAGETLRARPGDKGLAGAGGAPSRGQLRLRLRVGGRSEAPRRSSPALRLPPHPFSRV